MNCCRSRSGTLCIVRRLIFLGVEAGVLLLLSANASAEWQRAYSPSGIFCYDSYTSTARYNEIFNGYESYGISAIYYPSSTCAASFPIWWSYIQTRGWNNDGGWHIAEYNDDVGYPYVCCSRLETAWTAACGDWVCNRSWYITSMHLYQETSDSYNVQMITSNDGAHSTGQCYYYGC